MIFSYCKMKLDPENEKFHSLLEPACCFDPLVAILSDPETRGLHATPESAPRGKPRPVHCYRAETDVRP
jgi:hypothetical protein